MVALANSCRDLPSCLKFCKRQFAQLHGHILNNPRLLGEYCGFYLELGGSFQSDPNVLESLSRDERILDDMFYFASHPELRESDDVNLSFRWALLFLEKAIRNQQDGKETEAWINLAESRFHMGIVDCALFIKITKESPDDLTYVARKGGRNRGSKLDTLRDIFIRLLESEKPSRGWKTRSDAVARLLTKVSEIYEEQKKNDPTLYQVPDMATTLRNWLKQNPVVRDVYDRHAAAPGKQTMPADNQP
ncbi:hypothetical protein LH442_03905 [Laribacter hongkongensis]|uniref:hypothetical protein n=1 Tax=Laribacter hongkongensis TaxID=168471 RepID=UPI001EFD2B92|nr:hypothetical protein [Laribacter hongkongensis]MCG9055146.1 hypothetical protein [Laribacter hongkongensis]MCG9114811.1 hypothetical protein [Laribacter hongkongensis]